MDHYLAASDDAYLNRLEALPDRLIFLLGPHRSGTTFLHQLLADSKLFEFISYYDIVEFNRLLFNHHNNQQRQATDRIQAQLNLSGPTRNIDSIAIGPFQSEEYGFILDRSPFNNYNSNPISNTEFSLLKVLCQKKHYLSKSKKPLLLKNPNDFYDGFIRIAAEFPQAQFIFIHRHPLLVFNSQVTAWRQLMDKQSPWLSMIDTNYIKIFETAFSHTKYRMSLLMDSGLENIFHTLCKAYEFYLLNISTLSPSQFVSLRYEDLCDDPVKEMSIISKRIELPISLVSQDIKSQPRTLLILPEVERIYKANSHLLGPYLDKLGYSHMPKL
jgi:hypothetical protein